jgi:CheY-like chemotaxis protein
MNELSSKSILLVDDEAVIRRILKRAISTLERPVEVCEAEDGLEALKIIGQRGFDLILLDVKMPGMDGFEVLSKIRQAEDTKHQKVMMLTGENQVEDIYKGREHGATSYLTKPFDVEDILLVLESHLSGEFDFESESNRKG